MSALSLSAAVPDVALPGAPQALRPTGCHVTGRITSGLVRVFSAACGHERNYETGKRREGAERQLDEARRDVRQVMMQWVSPGNPVPHHERGKDGGGGNDKGPL